MVLLPVLIMDAYFVFHYCMQHFRVVWNTKGDICCGVTGEVCCGGAGRSLLCDAGMGRDLLYGVGEVCCGTRGEVCCEMQVWGVCGQDLLL